MIFARCALRPVLPPPMKPAWALSSIGVDPAWSGRGIGQGLLEAYVAEARKHGLKAFTLTTDADDNDAVNQFYRKVGFYLSRTFTQRDQRRMNEYRMNIL